MDSLTAKMSCFVRAYHYEHSDNPVFRDAYAKSMLGEDYELIQSSLMQGISFFLPSFKGTTEEGLQRIVEHQLAPSVLGRSAYCEDLLEKTGCKQYVVFGAGYDTYFTRKRM